MSWGDDFYEFADKLEELSDEFESRTEGRINNSGRDPERNEFVSPDGWAPKRRIADGITRAMRNGVVPEAKHNASRYVRDEAKETIQHEEVTWNRHRFFATNDLVKYHEFGTSTKATDKSKATLNAPGQRGYIIPVEGYDSLDVGPDAFPQMLDEIDFKYVVHPGVKARHFMRDALRHNTWLIEDRVAEELDDIEMDI